MIQDRFDQPGFKLFGQVKQLFLNSVNKEDQSDEIMTVESTFRGDYDHHSLITESQLLPAIIDDCKPVNFGDIIKDNQLLFCEKHKLVRNVALIARLVLTLIRLGFLNVVFPGGQGVNLTHPSYFKKNLFNFNITLYNC